MAAFLVEKAVVNYSDILFFFAGEYSVGTKDLALAEEHFQ